jgi:hypothetical protein
LLLVLVGCTLTVTLNYRRIIERNRFETERAVPCDPRQECQEKEGAPGEGP